MRERMVCETPHADAKVQLGWALPHSPQLSFAAPEQQTLEASPIYSHPEGHLLTIAPTGMGKGRSAIIPTLLSYPGSVIVVDPKLVPPPRLLHGDGTSLARSSPLTLSAKSP